ncbi:uncharacterized protein [Nicotiana tomentosiformis]|uniref:uncharacterized protein n=1 Tax=Nicotiana tomentosiformis TaxID=4098 RepID=UPI00388C78B7
MTMMELIDIRRAINLPSLMIQHMARIADTSTPKHAMPYCFMLTGLFDKLNIPLPEPKFGNHNDVLDVLPSRSVAVRRSRLGDQQVLLFYIAAELTKMFELALEVNAKLREDNDELRKETRQLREELRRDREAQAQQIATLATAVHREACSRSRVELRRYEADLRRVTEERNALRLFFGQREEKIKDLRAELAKAHQDQTDLIEQVKIILKTHGLDTGMVANILISQLQQKLEVIGKLCEEVDVIKAESLEWKEGMDRLAAEKEDARAQLLSAEGQLQGLKEKCLVQARKIEDLEARLASELVKAEKTKADADAFVDIYRADAEAAQVQAREAAETAKTRAYWVAELAKCQSQRETTLEEIHVRGFDLTEEIKRAKELETDVGALASDDDDNDDDDGSKSGSESGEDPDGEETAPGDN